jgi:regulator of cell morphogenesis and NO signaling
MNTRRLRDKILSILFFIFLEDNAMNTLSVLPATTLSEIVTKNYHTVSIFQRFKIDVCSHEKLSIADVCQHYAIKIDVMLKALEECQQVFPHQAALGDVIIVRFHEWGADFLVDFILANHHDYTKQILPVIASRARKVALRHKHPELVHLSDVISALEQALVTHLYEEEQVLFPYIKKLSRAKTLGAKLHPASFGSAQQLIEERKSEHQQIALYLHKIINDNDFTLPESVCRTCKLLFQELNDFEKDLRQHIYLKNEILFPHIMALEHTVITKEQNANDL